jgi:hypothetical protein
MATGQRGPIQHQAEGGKPLLGHPPLLSVSSVWNHFKTEERARERRKWWVRGKYDQFKKKIVEGKTKYSEQKISKPRPNFINSLQLFPILFDFQTFLYSLLATVYRKSSDCTCAKRPEPTDPLNFSGVVNNEYFHFIEPDTCEIITVLSRSFTRVFSVYFVPELHQSFA